MPTDPNEELRDACNATIAARNAADAGGDSHAHFTAEQMRAYARAAEREASPPTIGHLHSNGDFCVEHMPAGRRSWPVPLFERATPTTESRGAPKTPPLPSLPDPIGQIVGTRLTPPGTDEFWGYWREGFRPERKEEVYTREQLQDYARAALSSPSAPPADSLVRAAGQASFCLRSLLPDDPDAQMTVRMLEAALARPSAPPADREWDEAQKRRRELEQAARPCAGELGQETTDD